MKPNIGVSPLARGSQAGASGRGLMRRCIPTCAGQPYRRVNKIEVSQVYPHLRGAAPLGHQNKNAQNGVSPLARGSLYAGACSGFGSRCIPTCAGQPKARRFWKRRSRVYPHLRGAARHRAQTYKECAGVSPLARGSLELGGALTSDDGCIPTCAGQPGVRQFRRRS